MPRTPSKEFAVPSHERDYRRRARRTLDCSLLDAWVSKGMIASLTTATVNDTLLDQPTTKCIRCKVGGTQMVDDDAEMILRTREQIVRQQMIHANSKTASNLVRIANQ